MFDLRREELQRQRAARPIQSLDDIAQDLGMDEVFSPTTLVDIKNAIRETFDNWARRANPEGEGEMVFAYDAM